MDKTYFINNSQLKIGIRQTGAELCSIQRISNKKEYMWGANPNIWKGHAPILFPIVGALKEQTYLYNGKTYQLLQHGFFRKNNKVQLVEQTAKSLTFCLESSDETLRVYPFQFAFYTSYELKENAIIINHQVVNKGERAMYFSLGAHPAFKCPFIGGEQYSDYHIELEQNETAYTYEITKDGLIGNESDLVLNNSNKIDLHYQLFDRGALVFKGLKSRKAKLVSKKSGDILEISYEGFPYLGIWAKPNADYVCIEPWQGIADSFDADQLLKDKEGIIELKGQGKYVSEYMIKIF